MGWLALLVFHCLVIANYNLIALKGYEEKHVFEQLSPNGQKVFAGLAPYMPNTVPTWVRPYAHYAGINTGYSLFAPNVPSAISVIFELTDPAGNSIAQLPILNSDEGLDRLSGNFSTFSSFEEIRELLTYGWAMRMLEINPGYTKIAVVVGSHRMPTMQAFREGVNPTFVEVGRYEYSLEQ